MIPALLLALACQPAPAPPAPPARPLVVAASVPVHHLAQRVGAGQPWDLVLLPPADADPGAWRPAPDAVARAQGADLVLLNGFGYEAWAATTALPATRAVQTAAGVPPLHRAARTHSHGTEGAHDHGDVDPHTWSDPLAYAEQARATHAALAALPGADRATLDAELASLRSELEQLEAALRAAAPPADRALASNHPSFGHLGRRLGLRIEDFDLDPATPPSTPVAAAVEAWAAGAADPTLLWEAEPSAAVRAALPASLTHLTLDPLEHPPPGGTYDYAAQARGNVAALQGLGAD